MEEIEYKLTLKSPTLILNAVSKLVNNIAKAIESDQTTKINELPELKLLKKLCQNTDPIVSQTACHGLVALVEEGALNLTSTLSDFIASIPYIINFNGTIVSIASLLVLQTKKDKTQIGSKLQSVHHPFIMLMKMKKSETVCFDIYKQINIIFNHEDKDICSTAIKLLRPVFLYVLCDTSNKLPLTFRQQMWDLLQQSANSHDDMESLIEVLSWLQIDSDDAFLWASSMYVRLAELALKRNDLELCIAMAPSLASHVQSSLKRGHDPRHCLSILKHLLQAQTEAHSCVLILLAESLSLSPAIYCKDILTACLIILEEGSYNVMSEQMLFCAILPWLVHPSHLVSDGIKLASKLLGDMKRNHKAKVDSTYLCVNEWFCQLQNTDSRVDFATELCKLSERWEEIPDTILPWLERLTKTPDQLTDEFHLFLSALLLCDFNQDGVKQSCLKILLSKAVRSNEMAATLLPVLLYKIAREEQPFFLMELLRGLTALAVYKENIAVVVSTLESLKREESLQCCVVDLYTHLWRIENRCYTYLQPLLVQTTQTSWKLDISRVAAIKEICIIRPEQHGTELVSLLSQVLTRCVDERQNLAASLALQGITALCRADIVDAATTWRVLSPRLRRDKRSSVEVSLCDFFSIVPSLPGSGEEYERFVEEAVATLWCFISTSDNIVVIQSALAALSQYKLGYMSLKTLPEQYHCQIKLSKTVADEAQKPEEVFAYVPGGCWLLLLENMQTECLQFAGRILIGWIAAELNEYRGIYQIPASGEPSNYHHLNQRSVLRAITDRLRHASVHSSHVEGESPVERECLRILSHDYSKPLPPFNWSFLQELVTLRRYWLGLAAKQSLTSPSARRLIDNHLSTFQPSIEAKEDILDLFTILGDLCKGIPPTNLRPSLEKSLRLATQEDESVDLLMALLGHIKTALLRTDIHESNRNLLSSQVQALLPHLEPQHPAFSSYVNCVIELPVAHVERMSSPSLWWETSEVALHQAVALRGAMACRLDSEVPLVWLNEFIDATAHRTSDHGAMLREMSSVVISCRSHVTNWRWIMELLGRIQCVISSDPSQQSVEYLCNVVLMSVIILAGHDVRTSSPDSVATSLEARLELFPQAIATLSAQETDKDAALVMEWLHSMQCTTVVSSMYNAVFRQGLLAMRHRSYFHKPTVSERFINKI